MTLERDLLDNTLNLVNILEEGWTAANTDDKTPVIKRVYDIATPSMSDLKQADFILIYAVGYDERYIDIGAFNVGSDDRYTIDIRTANGQSRMRKLWKEVRKLLWAKRIDPTDDNGDRFPFAHIVPLSRLDLTDKSKHIFRMTYDVELRRPVEKVVSA